MTSVHKDQQSMMYRNQFGVRLPLQLDNSSEGVQSSTLREGILEHKSTQVLCDKNIIKKRVIGDEVSLFQRFYDILNKTTRPEFSRQEELVVQLVPQLVPPEATTLVWS